MDSFEVDHLFIWPVSKYNHNLKYERLGIHINLGKEEQFSP